MENLRVKKFDNCDFCGTPYAKFYCEICGANYCKKCASVPDEGGWTCPDEGCCGYGDKAKPGEALIDAYRGY